MRHVCPYAAAEDTEEAATGFCHEDQAVGQSLRQALNSAPLFQAV